MKLLGSITSPYVRKVRVVALEKKIDLDFVVEDVWAESSLISTQNPLGKIPVLILDDGPLFDSRVITQYLDARAPTQRLIPEANRERATVRMLEAVADGICDAAISMMLERRFHPAGVSEPWIERQAKKVSSSLSLLSVTLGPRQFLVGETFSLADIACAVSLGYLNLRFPENTWQTSHPNLNSFFERMSSRESFLKTLPSN